ncbi:DUF3093 domain-containing protein [Aeromicrobium wangtongii]|uniref:DUF3093 domain-containing protein n=1 Tax=Aeromicrobium wangtongii TaxID=2969247 RepID=A0ABY5MGZ1_9ACTN|nr:DUF3093 domain-containing protein [Aeromicrobium wangtongii]MCD9197661.1 DUF3093 domain-containing protein [Aeromicrobium wangtongii]UUP15146.1 DUF3093 domain-containing protein [Aeromicrobium wangtongii]
MTTYRERLTAPLSWWFAALGFAVVWGWLFLVATTWIAAIVVTVLLAAAGFYAVWRYGSVLITVGPEGLRVGRAFVEATHVGNVTALDRAAYRTQLGTGANARAHLVTRPYLDHGVLVDIDDPADPTPYWLVSSRHPADLAAALSAGGTGSPTAPHDTNGDAPRGEEG